MRPTRIELFLYRPVELWIVCLIVLSGAAASVALAWAVKDQITGGTRLGAFGPVVMRIASLPSDTKRVLVRAFGILTDSAAELQSPEQRFGADSGFRFNYAPGARPELGYLLLNRYDGDNKRSVSELWDLRSQERVWTWSFAGVDALWRRSSLETRFDFRVNAQSRRFRNNHALVNDKAEVITGLEAPLIRADACSRLEFINQQVVYHHSIERALDGNYWVPFRIEPKSVDIGGENFLDDGLKYVSPDGVPLFSKSVVQILIDNGLAALVHGSGTHLEDDPIHLNDIQPAPNDGRHWRKGDVFLSLRHQSMVLLYRPSANKVLWYKQGPWVHQHDVNILNDHQISVFNNNAYRKGPIESVVRGVNDIIVYDFDTDRVTSPWEAGFKSLELRTISEGRGEVVGGEVFVEETNYGRAVQFDASGKLTWQFINRGDDGWVYVLNWSRIVPRQLGDQVRRAVSEAKCN
jgi:hypothetical protein